MSRSDFATPRCPGSLKEGFISYNPSTIRNVFAGKKVFHVIENRLIDHFWSGAKLNNDDFPSQQWFRLTLLKNKFLPSINGEYLLKTADPFKTDLRFPMEQAANEHLCLQLASQVFELATIPNALIFFSDGTPAIIYKYFNEMSTFQSFRDLFSIQNPKMELKYYRQVMEVIDKHVAASIVAKERYFSQVLFSWLSTNATAHVKYSGLVKTQRGDYVIAPINTISCTRLHKLSDEFSLSGGLFEGDKNTPVYRENGQYTRNEFTSFANRVGISNARTEKLITLIFSKKNQALQLIDQAFLPDDAKSIFKYNFSERIARLE